MKITVSLEIQGTSMINLTLKINTFIQIIWLVCTIPSTNSIQWSWLPCQIMCNFKPRVHAELRTTEPENNSTNMRPYGPTAASKYSVTPTFQNIYRTPFPRVLKGDHVKLLVWLNSVLHLYHLNLPSIFPTEYMCNTVHFQIATAE